MSNNEKIDSESELHNFAENYELIRENEEYYDVPQKSETPAKEMKELSEEEVFKALQELYEAGYINEKGEWLDNGPELSEEQMDAALGELYEAGYIDENCNLLVEFEKESPAQRLFDSMGN